MQSELSEGARQFFKYLGFLNSIEFRHPDKLEQLQKKYPGECECTKQVSHEGSDVPQMMRILQEVKA